MRAEVVSLAVVLALLAACQPGQSVRAQPDIVIASDLPLTSKTAQDVPSVSQAIQLEISEHGTVGRFKVGYEPFDDAPVITAPVKGVQNVRQMIAQGRVLGYVGPFTSSGAFAQIQLANSAGLAMVNPSSTNWCLTLPDSSCNPQPAELRTTSNNFFRIAAPDPVQGRAIARLTRNALQVKRAAAFTMNDPFDDKTLEAFTGEFTKEGGEVVWSQNLPDSTTNFTAFLKAAQARGAEAIFAATEQPAACSARAQMKGILPQDVYFLGMDVMQEDPDCIGNAAGNAEGMFATVSVADVARSSDPTVQKVVRDYAKAYPKNPTMSSYAFAAYDCAAILLQAIAQAVAQDNGGFPTRSQVVEQIAKSQFKGITGSFSFDSNGDAVSPLMALYEVKGGQWVYLRQIDASVAGA